MKNRIVFVDTNVVDGDKSFNHLLGNRRKLTELAKSADLVIPKVVIDELINHKLHIYQSEKSHFVKNPSFLMLESKRQKSKNWNLSPSKNSC